jgi:hypothetical protein
MADVLHEILREVPRTVAFGAILVAGWLIAKAVRKIVDGALERVGFDRAVERGGIRAALERSGYDAGDLVATLAYYAVLLVTLQIAFGIWGPNPVSVLITAVVGWLPKAFVAIVVVVVAAVVARTVKDIVGSVLGSLSYGRLLAGSASAVIVGLGVIAALNQIGVATAVTTPVLVAVLATVGGVIVVGVGGGLVRPMQDRWSALLDRAEDAAPAIVEQARAYDAGRRDAEAAAAALRADAATRAAAERAAVEATVPLHVLSDDQTVVIPRGAIPNR